MDSHVLLRTCNICVQIFQNQTEYLEHRKIVHSKNNKERSSVCKECDRTFTHKYYLQRHTQLVHSKNLREGKCDQCEETMENRYQLTIHKRKEHTEKKFSCDYCPLKFSVLFEKERHQRLHLNMRDFACEKCAYKGNSDQSLRIHKIQKHNSDFRPYKCALCPMAFPRVTSLYQHKTTHENVARTSKDFECPICGKGFINARSSDSCKKGHASEGFKCSSDSCPATFPTKYLVRKHLIEAHNESQQTTEKNLHLCHMCDKSFRLKCNRNKHIRRMHEKKPEANIPCTICPKKFVDKISFKRHQLIHSGDVFKCPFEGCETSSRMKYYINHHYKQKHGQVTHRKSLEERLASERERNQKIMCYLCKIYIKAGRGKETWKRHLRTHDNQVPLSCIVKGCSDQIYFTRDKQSHSYNLPSQFYDHLTKQHDIDLNKNAVCVKFKCNHCDKELLLVSSQPAKRAQYWYSTAKSWKTALIKHMTESHVNLAEGLNIKNDWESHYKLGSPFIKERVQELET